MQIYTGIDYSYKWKYYIQKCIKDAKENPFTTYYVIVKDPSYIEEAFLHYTNALFNIEILTLEGLLRKLQMEKTKTLTTLQKTMLVKQVLENNKDTILYQPNTIFSSIHDILAVFDAYYYADIQPVNKVSLTSLSKEKVTAFYSLYQQYMQSIPNNYVHNSLDNIAIKLTGQVFYFMEECILQPRIRNFVASLDTQNTVYIISNHTEDDSRILQFTYQLHFKKYPSTKIINNNTYQQFLTSQLFSNEINKYNQSHPFYIMKETNPIEEVKSVCFAIFQDIVENNFSYQDFAIYYPNTQYLEMIKETLSSFNMPSDTLAIPKEYPIISVCLTLLHYIKTADENEFIELLDSLLLKKCPTFKQVNYYKKQYQETNQIVQESYNTIKQHFIDTYITPFHSATTVQDKSTIILTFLQEEVIYDDSLATITTYFTTLQSYQDDISLAEYIELIHYTKPTHCEEVVVKQDHIYVCNYQQTYSSLLPIKKIYLLGLNETIVPPAIKDEGMLLDYEKTKLGLTPTIVQTLSLQQNHFLKILTSSATSIVLSYAMASTTNETLLPSSYVLHLQQLFTIPSMQTKEYYNHPANAHRLYALGQFDSHYTTVNQMISFYTQRKNQPESLKVLPYKETMSASQLETYNACAYKYFCQYGLEIQPLSSATLQANEIGTLVHYILEASAPFFKNREQVNQSNPQMLKEHIDTTMTTYLQLHPEIALKTQQIRNRFFIECIKEDMYNTLLILMHQMAASTFTLDSTEEKLQSQYGTIKIKGFVDRVDIYANYVKVIDYKSSDKDLDLSLAMQGFNIQMLLYMDILASQKQLNKGALLYFNTKKRILKSSLSILEPELPANFFKLYRMNGYAVEDIVTDIDNHIDTTSQIIKARYVKKDDSYKGNILSQTALQKLLQEVGKHITYIYNQIFSGEISVRPKASNDPTVHTKVNPCSFCPYQAICNLDVFYNTPTLVKNMDVDSILGGEEDANNTTVK